MEEFKIEEKEKDPSSAIKDACLEIIKDLKPQVVKLEGRYDPSSKTFIVEGKCVENDKVKDMIERIFFDLLYYLPVDVRGKRYRLSFTTYSDVSFTRPKSKYYLETSLDYMPDTGAVTRSAWEKFISQLIYTKDGKKRFLPEPTPFWDEVSSDEGEHAIEKKEVNPRE